MSRNFESNNNDYIEVGDVPALDFTGDEITVALWLRLESTTAERKAFAKWSDAGGDFQYLISALADGHVQMVVNTGSNGVAEGTTDMNDGDWHHIAGIYDGSNVRVYEDGVEEGSTSLSGNMISNNAPVRIGAGSGGSGTENPFDGEIGHCAVWDVPLTASEVASLAAGINPLKIRSENRLFYAPLNGQDPELDVVGGLSLTVNGPTKSEEPPIPNSIVAP